MENYRVIFLDEADDDLSKLDKPARKRIIQKIEWLRDHFDETIHIPLSYEFRDFLKLRVGKWRVIYSVNAAKHEISIAQIEHRDKVYKR